MDSWTDNCRGAYYKVIACVTIRKYGKLHIPLCLSLAEFAFILIDNQWPPQFNATLTNAFSQLLVPIIT